VDYWSQVLIMRRAYINLACIGAALLGFFLAAPFAFAGTIAADDTIVVDTWGGGSSSLGSITNHFISTSTIGSFIGIIAFDDTSTATSGTPFTVQLYKTSSGLFLNCTSAVFSKDSLGLFNKSDFSPQQAMNSVSTFYRIIGPFFGSACDLSQFSDLQNPSRDYILRVVLPGYVNGGIVFPFDNTTSRWWFNVNDQTGTSTIYQYQNDLLGIATTTSYAFCNIQFSTSTGFLSDLANGFASRQISQTVVRVPANATHIRSLLPINTMTSAVFEYPQENSPAGEGAPGYQGAEGTLKPQVDYDITMVQIKPVTIAAWMSVSRQALQDIGWLSGYASRKMTEDLLNFEDQEILMGANGSNQLNGLVTQATAYTRTDGTWNTIFEYLIDAISQQETLNLPPTGILLHPRDYAQLLRYKTTTGEFDFPGLVFAGDNRATLYFMGLPIYKNNKIPRLTGLVGDWNQAELLVREGITFDVSYEDATNFRQNLVTLRIEERIALADYIPRAFMRINFATILS